MTRKTTKKIPFAIAIIVLSLIAVQSIQITRGLNGGAEQWGLSFSAENAQNVTSTSFTPFEQIQLSSTVTYGNASVPDLLVTFKVQGPTGSANPISITTIGKTNAAGVADSAFRLPVEEENSNSVIGTWQATATIRTSNSTIQKNLSFTTRWNLEITSVSIENQQGHNQTIFYPGNTVTVALAITDVGSPQQANITIDMKDASGKAVNQTQIENTQINSSSTSPTQLQASLEIPTNAVAGEASITAAIYSGTYQNTGIPAGENQTAYFTVIGNGVTTSSPSPRPTNTPNIFQNSVSLFSWLLVSTGLFTFTLLYLFLRRKPEEVGTQLPSAPSTVPSPVISVPLPVEGTQQKSTQQPTMPVGAATVGVAPEKTFQASVTEIESTLQMQEKPVAVTEATVEPTSLESAVAQEPTPKTMLNQVSRVQGTAKRIQAIKTVLESEEQQFAQELAELNRKVDEREKTLKNYVDTIRGEFGKLQKYITDNEDVTPEKTAETSALEPIGKPDLESILSEEIVLEAMSKHQNRILSLTKRMEALKLVLKLEKEQLGKDFEELDKAVDDHEKTIKNHFNTVREEIEKLKKNLTEKEDTQIVKKTKANNKKGKDGEN
jgi:hypothetical protein